MATVLSEGVGLERVHYDRMGNGQSPYGIGAVHFDHSVFVVLLACIALLALLINMRILFSSFQG